MADMNFNVGGSNTNLLNGGGATDAVAVGDISAANGGVISAPAAVTMTDNTVIRLNDDGTNGFADAEVGHLVHVTFASVYTSGRRPIVAVDPSGDWIEIPDNYTSTVAVTNVRVGGAVPILGGGSGTNWGLQEVFDDTLASAATDNVAIYMTGDATLTANLDKDVGGGSSTTMWNWYGCDSSYARLTPTREQISGGIANGALNTTDMPVISTATFIVNIPVDYVTVEGIKATGSNAASIVGSTGVDHSTFANCSFTNTGNGAGSSALRVNNSCIVYNCDIIHTGATAATIGINSDTTTKVINCRLTLSTTSATSKAVDINNGLVMGCVFFGLDGIAIAATAATPTLSIIGNTFEDVLTCIEINDSNVIFPYCIVNNISKGHTTFVNSPNASVNIISALFNNLNGAISADYDTSLTGIIGYQDISGDPAFVLEGSNDYNLKNTSPSKNTGPLKQDRGAMSSEESGGGAGGLITHPGMSGGFRA